MIHAHIFIKARHQFTYDQWPWNNFPSFLEGSAFLISGSAIPHLLAAAQVTQLSDPIINIHHARIVSLQFQDENVRHLLNPKVFPNLTLVSLANHWQLVFQIK